MQNKIRAVVSTYYQAMKFITPKGIGFVLGDKKVVRQCYLTDVEEAGPKNIFLSTVDTRDEMKNENHRLSPLDSLEEIDLGIGDPRKTARMGNILSKGLKKK